MWWGHPGPEYIPTEKEMEQRRRDIREGRGAYRGGLLGRLIGTLIAFGVILLLVMLLT